MVTSSKQIYRQFRRAGEPEADLAPPADWARRGRYLVEYGRWLWPHRRRVAAVFGLAAAASGLGLVLPYATKVLVDQVLLAQPVEPAVKLRWLHLAGLGLVLVVVAQQGLEALRIHGMTVLSARLVFGLRRRLYEHLLHQPLHVLGELKVGGVITRLSGDVDEVTGLLQMGVVTPGVSVLRVVMTVAVLFALNLPMALLASALIPRIMLINVVYLRKVRPLYRSMRRDRSEIDGRVGETFAGIRVVRVFRREKKEARDFAVRHHAVIRKNVLAELLQLVVTVGWGLLIPLASLVIIWYGGVLYLHGRATIGSIMAFQMYIFMLLHPVSQIVFSYGATQRALAALERLFSTLEQPVD